MSAIPRGEAAERLAAAVETASSDDLVEIYAELHPENAFPAVSAALAAEIAAHIRKGIEPEELVDLWNVVFPTDRDVSYDEEEDALQFNERRLRYAEH